VRQVQAVPTARSTAPVSSAVVQAVDDVPKICPGNVHDAFCKIEGWEQVRDAQGRTGTHHVIYELQLHDGRILRTRVSHPVNRDTYGASLWSHILPDQLEVDQATFWACVQEGKKPDRGAPEPPQKRFRPISSTCSSREFASAKPKWQR